MPRTMTAEQELNICKMYSNSGTTADKILAELDAERVVSKALAEALAEVLEDTVTSAAIMSRWQAALTRYREGL